MKIILQKLLDFKYQIAALVIVSVAIGSLFVLAPRFITILRYFWPLLFSTLLFLVAVAVFGRISPPPPAVSGEGLMDYVAGQQELEQHNITQETYKQEKQQDDEN
uniref:Uncharacterized protein n=1 Tax=Kalanchoe fedtschenkoi TaxID=63787 RepID=A0A7N0U2A4_KALFE